MALGPGLQSGPLDTFGKYINIKEGIDFDFFTVFSDVLRSWELYVAHSVERV